MQTRDHFAPFLLMIAALAACAVCVAIVIWSSCKIVGDLVPPYAGYAFWLDAYRYATVVPVVVLLIVAIVSFIWMFIGAQALRTNFASVVAGIAFAAAVASAFATPYVHALIVPGTENCELS